MRDYSNWFTPNKEPIIPKQKLLTQEQYGDLYEQEYLKLIAKMSRIFYQYTDISIAILEHEHHELHLGKIKKGFTKHYGNVKALFVFDYDGKWYVHDYDYVFTRKCELTDNFIHKFVQEVIKEL